MKACRITQDNLETLKKSFQFEEYAHIETDPKKGKYVHHTESETDDIIGRYLVVDSFWPRGFGVVSEIVFESSFQRNTEQPVDSDGWFHVRRVTPEWAM